MLKDINELESKELFACPYFPPLGADSFIEKMECLLDRKLKLKKPELKKKDKQGVPGITING